ncbi:MAG: hypothetical protein II567_16370 [Candidatus Riflebacteria bacterium]|nr:hypothetical protein [Candidatus Riflebacteria bacterium]
MEYFLQYIHNNNDSNHLTLLDDEPEVLLIDNQPLINFTFKEDRLYYITFSIKTKPILQSFKIKLVNLKNNQIDE